VDGCEQGSWHFEGMTESEDDDFKLRDDDDPAAATDNENDPEGSGEKKVKNSLNFHFFDQMHVLQAAGGAGYEDACVSHIQRLGQVTKYSIISIHLATQDMYKYIITS
jgi:hypothetical protein